MGLIQESFDNFNNENQASEEGEGRRRQPFFRVGVLFLFVLSIGRMLLKVRRRIMGRLMMDRLFNTWMGIVLLALWLVWDYTGLRYKVLSFFFLSWLRKIDGDG